MYKQVAMQNYYQQEDADSKSRADSAQTDSSSKKRNKLSLMLRNASASSQVNTMNASDSNLGRKISASILIPQY